jgi:hypothetical protein
VRTHSAASQEYFEQIGVGRAFMGERELALGMARYALLWFGCRDEDTDKTMQAIRQTAEPSSDPRDPGRRIG